MFDRSLLPYWAPRSVGARYRMCDTLALPQPMVPEAISTLIPIHDDNPTRGFPWLTVLLIAGNIAVFGFEVTRSPAELAQFIDQWAFVPARLHTGAAPAALLTLVTSAFLHGGWLHLGGNMLYLWVFGNNIEDR
ncbi:MAG: rhomboid family intramembrane serine protease, partial [Actinobacteria bacterium]|nr:rhomboid family intramembrane serine protease [Actinomycetota bacterium]